MKKLLTAIALLTAVATTSVKADNQKIVGMAPQFDKRIVTAYINGYVGPGARTVSQAYIEGLVA